MGFNIVKSSSKDTADHRVFLSLDDLKAGYDHSLSTAAPNYHVQTKLLDAYTSFVAVRHAYDIYFGVVYSPFIKEKQV